MKKVLLCFLIATAFVCKEVKSNIRFSSDLFRRCENDEVVCYVAEVYKGGGISCKWKEKAE